MSYPLHLHIIKREDYLYINSRSSAYAVTQNGYFPFKRGTRSGSRQRKNDPFKCEHFEQKSLVILFIIFSVRNGIVCTLYMYMPPLLHVPWHSSHPYAMPNVNANFCFTTSCPLSSICFQLLCSRSHQVWQRREKKMSFTECEPVSEWCNVGSEWSTSRIQGGNANKQRGREKVCTESMP